MDRSPLSAIIIREMGDVFVEALAKAGPELMAADLDEMEQRLQDLSRSVLGKVVEEVVCVRAAAQSREPPVCPHCQQRMRLVDPERPRHLQGLVGDYTVVRPYFLCDRCHVGAAPLDAQLGIGPGALSPGLGRVACRLGIDGSFGESPDTLWETLRVDVPDEAVRRITEGIGQVAEAEEKAAMALAQAGRDPLPATAVASAPATLLVEVDGALVHLDDDWHEAKVGLAASLGPQTRDDPDTGRATLVMGKPSYCAGFEAAETFWYRVYVDAWRQGLGSAALIVVLGDGADWIWRYAARFLAVGGAEIVEIVDIYHAFEHLAIVANAVFGSGTPAARAWTEGLKKRLREEGAAPVLGALAALFPTELAAVEEGAGPVLAPLAALSPTEPAAVEEGAGPVLAPLAGLSPTEPAAVEEVRKALGYFTAHAQRMDYPAFLARQLPIGSGAVESACKTLIEEREKGAGMRWTRTGAQAVASLRAVHRSGGWREFWNTHPQRRRPAVFPRHPELTQHDDMRRQQAA